MKIPDPSPAGMVKFHFIMLISWTALIPISAYYVIKKGEPLWVIVMSHYAILVSHWAGWDAARAEVQAEGKKEDSGR